MSRITKSPPDLSHKRTPDISASRSDLWAKVRLMLTPPEWDCLQLWIVEGVPQSLVGDRIGVTQQFVSKTLLSATSKLRANVDLFVELMETVSESHHADERGLDERPLSGRDDPLDHLYDRDTWNEGCRDDC